MLDNGCDKNLGNLGVDEADESIIGIWDDSIVDGGVVVLEPGTGGEDVIDDLPPWEPEEE